MSAIPVTNLYHLLAYAWDALDELPAEAPVSAVGEWPMPDLLAALLTTAVARLLRRGLQHHYTTVEEETPRFRGRLLLTATLRANSLRRGRAWCAHDEYPPDTLPNQLIHTTLYQLHVRHQLPPELHERLTHLLPRLADVPLLQPLPSPAIFDQVRLHRHTAHYRLPLLLCRLIWETVLLSEVAPTADQWLKTFLRDKRRMASLFEKFVGNLLRHRLPNNHVGATQLTWHLRPTDDPSKEVLPRMKTDVTVRQRDMPHPAALIECKYYPKALLPNLKFKGKDKLRPAHLYQLFAYYQHLTPQPPATSPFRLILLYPVAHQAFHYRYRVPGTSHLLHVATLDLREPWDQIEAALLALVLEPIGTQS